MTQLLANKVALVTGAGSGIGRATAIAFARNGASVVGCDVDSVSVEKTVETIRSFGGTGGSIAADVTDERQVEALLAKIVKDHGRIDCAFNNAGVEGDVALITDYSERTYERVMNVNVKGVFLCMKYELRQMAKQQSGSIVNTASGAGLVGFPTLSVYVASKHAVIGLTKSGALEYAKAGIRVNAICPGPIDTMMMARLAGGEGQPSRSDYEAIVPMKRYGKPEEMAEAVVWLCSEAASFVTGIAFSADGGLVAQ
jgi:NAD(P)-dependent dehydrogenase (short-subunit alcohol dehydrogenase family)